MKWTENKNRPIFVIAEAGSNHNGDFELAKKLVQEAKKSKANAVKFQSFKADELFSTKSRKVNNFDVFDLFEPLEVSNSWLTDLNKYCNDVDIEFMCTPFDERSVDFLYDLGVKRLKVSGFESTDLRFIRHVASTELPIIVSAGLGCSVDFIQRIISTCKQMGCDDITILHCNSAYPTPQEEINLDTIVKIGNQYPNIKVGLSDHTLSTVTPALAVMLGATCIEKHFTLSKSMEGPDHSFALEPNELAQMVHYIHTAEASRGLKDTFTVSEKEGSIQGMRSIILKNDIKRGEKLTSDKLTTKRPFYEGNIPACDFFSITDRQFTASCDLKKDDFLLKTHLKEVK